MKRLTAVFLATALVLILAAGCENDKSPEEPPREPAYELEFGSYGRMESYDDYLQYLEDYSDKSFFTFEKNDVFGEFDGFATYGYNNTVKSYAYWFRGGAGTKIIHVGFANKPIEELDPGYYDSFEKLSEADITDPADLRYVGDPGIEKAVLMLDKIVYIYHSGKLVGISFFVNGLDFLLSAYSDDGNGGVGSRAYWADLEKNQLTPFIQRLLNAETAPAAVAELAARVPK